MARTKQRETYGNGSVSPVMVKKLDSSGAAVMRGGEPVKVQQKDREGKLVWRVAVTLGVEKYVDSQGHVCKRQRKVQRLVHGTLAEARAVCKKMVEDYEHVDAGKARERFGALVEEWSRSEDIHDDDGSLTCSEKQLKQYLRHLGYVARYLDEKALVDITRDDVNTALAQVQQVGGKGRPLSATTMGKIRKLVRRVFEYAVDEEYLVRSPLRQQRRRRSSQATPDPTARQRRALTEEEASRLCAQLDEDEATAYAEFAAKEQRQADWGNTFNRSAVRGVSTISCLMAVRLMLATGMRRGEALALTWANVDLQKGTVRVAQTLTESVVVKRPKTDAGIRSMYLDENTVEHLRRWKEAQKTALHLVMREEEVGGERRLVPADQTPETPVCCSDVGGWLDPTNVYRWWSGYRESRGFHGVLLHELRHTSVTLLLGNGIGWGMVQERIGHARPTSVTLTYLHELPANDRPAADVMGRILYLQRSEGEVLSMDRKTA